MAQTRIVVKADRLHPLVSWTAAFSQSIGQGISRAGQWAGSTAQRGASVVAALLGPAILSLYMVAVWSLTSEMGWTDSFPFTSGAFSNWMVWTGLAVSLHAASVVLNRQRDKI